MTEYHGRIPVNDVLVAKPLQKGKHSKTLSFFSTIFLHQFVKNALLAGVKVLLEEWTACDIKLT